jgi:Bifunctional DNA primase/polymerase, N-terminal/AAA domain/Primase C terminal 1 (PriCT-1)
MKNNLVQVAISYAEKGFQVFPCRPKSKKPATPNGFKDATMDEQTILGWWEQNPQYNIAVATGKASGFVVLDVDGDAGEQTIRERGLHIPATVLVRTGNGWHHWFAYPEGEGLRNSVGILGKGLDIRGDGGFVVVPPSVHPDGEAYEWGVSLEAATLAECPDWLTERRSGPYNRPKVDVRAMIEEGSRNSELYRVGCLLRRTYEDYEDILTGLTMHNERRCNPPLPTNEVERIAGSVMRYEPEKEQVSPSPKKVESDTGEIGVIMSEVQAERVEWLWESRIPLGKLTILDGDPSLGKSVITMDLAARVTTGRAFPNGDVDHVGNLDHLDHVDHLGGVVILSAEDGLADTIRPRLDAAGADTSKIVAISTVPDSEGNERTISIPQDITTIEAAIRRVGARLVIIDPLMAFLSGEANKDQDVRKALTPLARMAEHTGVAVLVIRHLNKQQGGKALYRGGSSIGIIGAARSGLVVETHPDNKDLRVLAMNKANLAEKAASLTYTITTAANDAARVVWGSATDLNADDILNPDTSEIGKAMDWLKSTLRDMPLPQKTVMDEGKAAGLSEKTIYRAKSALGIKSKRDGLGHTWRWHLTQDGQGSQDGQDSQDSQDRWLATVR